MMMASGLIGTTLTSGMIVGGICAFSASAAQTDDEDEDDDPTLAEQALTPATAYIAGEGVMPLADTEIPFNVADNATVTENLQLNPTAISTQALVMGSNSTLRGTITLLNDSWFQRPDNATGNACIESDIDAGGNKIRMWSDGFIFRGGSLTNLGEIEVLGPNNHAYIEQDITPDNMASGSTKFSSVATQGNGGHLHLSGEVSGFSEIYVSASGSGGHLHIDGTLIAEDGTIYKTGTGTLYIDGSLSGVSNINVAEGTMYIQSSTALVGSGEIEKNGTGALYLMADIAHTGTLTINAGTVYWSSNSGDTHKFALGFSKVKINAGATFWINHAEADQSSTSFTLNGGTLKMNDMSPNGLVFIAFDELELTADSAMTYVYNGALSFNVLTGSGTLTLEKTQGGNEVSELFFEDVYNFNGSIVRSNGNNHAQLPLRINTISQDAGKNFTIGDATYSFDVKSDAFYMSGEGSVTINGTLTTGEGMQVTGAGSLTITGNVTATGGFSKFGSGSLAIGGNLTSDGSFYMRHEGSLSIAGGITLADGTRLFYETHDGIDWKLVTATNGISTSGKLYVYSYEIDEAEMQQGFNLGLSTSNIDKDSIFALGYSAGEYDIY